MLPAGSVFVGRVHPPGSRRFAAAAAVIAIALGILLPLGAAAQTAGPAPEPAPPAKMRDLIPLAKPPRPRIIILSTFERSLMRARWQEDAIRQTFLDNDQHQYDMIRSDYLLTPFDPPGPTTPEQRRALADGLAIRYAELQPTLVITIDDLALELMLNEASGLFPRAPIVFSGYSGSPGIVAVAKRPVTGIYERPDIGGTVELMFRLLPNTRRIHCIAAGEDSSEMWREMATAALADVADRCEITWTAARTSPELFKELDGLGPNAAALFMSFQDQRFPSYRRRIEWKEPAGAPMFCLTQSHLRNMMVGGVVIAPEAMGRAAGRMALRILDGEDPAAIAATAEPSQAMMVSYPAMQRYGIPLSRLPGEAVVLDRPAPLYRTYRHYLVWGAIVLVVQAGVIAILLYARRIRRRAQSEIASERDRLDLAITGSGLGIWDWNVIKDRTSWTGMPGLRDELRERLAAPGAWERALHPDDREMVLGAIARHLERGEPYDVEYRLAVGSSDGQYRWFRSRGQAVRDSRGRAVRMVGTLVDVTDRRTAEESVRLSEARFRAAFDQHPFPMWVFDPESLRFMVVNDAAVRTYGYSREEFSQLTIMDIRPESEKQRLREILATRDPAVSNWFDGRHLLRDGTEIQVSITSNAVPWGSGQPMRLVTAIDVTERRSAEAMREQQRRIFEMIAGDAPLDQLLDGIATSTQAQLRRAVASILILGEDGQSVAMAAAPDLPAEFRSAYIGERIGPTAGSCGTAMWRRERVVTADIAQDPLWERYREPALEAGLRACWSEPIIGSGGEVLGSLGIYHRRPAEPAQRDLDLMSAAAKLAAIAIERRRLEEALRTAEANFRVLFQLASVGILRVDTEQRIVMANRRAAEIFGRPLDAIIGHSFQEFTHPDDRTISDRHYRHGLSTGEGYEFEKRYVRPDGSIVWASVSVRVVRGGGSPDAPPEYFVGAMQDITARKTAEAALQSSEQRFRRLVSDVRVIAWEADARTWRCTFVSPQAEGILGYPCDQWLEDGFWLRVIHPDDRERIVAESRERVATGVEHEHEYRVLHKDGRILWIRDLVSVEMEDGQPSRLRGVIVDVTAQKEAELQLERFFTLSPGMLCVAHHDRFIRVNPAFARALGYTERELCSHAFFHFVHEDDQQSTHEQLQRIVEGHETISFVNRYRHASGEYRWLSWRTAPMLPDGLIYAAARDVTEEHLAADALRRSELKYRQIVETAQEGVWVVDEQWITTFVNERMGEILGYRPEQMIGRHLSEFMDDQARQAAAANMSERQTGVSAQHDFRFKHADGRDVWTWISTNAILDDQGRFVGALAMITDITNRRAAEEALRRSEATNRAMVQAMPDLLFRMDRHGRYLDYWGPPDATLFRPPAEFLGKSAADILPPGRAEECMKALDAVFSSGLPQRYEYEVPCDDGGRTWEVRVVRIKDDEALLLVRDISDRRRAEAALREAEERYRRLVERLPLIVYTRPLEHSGEAYVSPQARDIVGVSPSRLAREPDLFLKLVHADDRERVRQILDRARRTGASGTVEYRLIRPDGREVWLREQVVTVPDASGEPAYLQGVAIDITAAKHADEALRDSQRKLSLLINQTPVGVIAWNTRFEVMQWNPAAERMFGFSASEIIGKHGQAIVPPEARPQVDSVWRQLLSNRGGSHSINDNLTKRGDRITCEWNNFPLIGSDGAVIGVASFVLDVTERTDMERRQGLMVRELDHRVKNNMAAVLSLAEQTGRASHSYEEFQRTFSERVRALTRLHTSLARNRWAGADLRSIVQDTVGAFTGDGSDRLVIDGPSVMLPPRAAQSLTMALNELATNASKYGALSTDLGRIDISWSVATSAGNGDSHTLRLAWVESGGPEVRYPERRGLGMELIEGAIAHQLGGEIAFQFQASGLRCSIIATLIPEEPFAEAAQAPL